ncbi:hypothetical protein [Pseudonocardia sp. T1-2H]|uniref:hypothetical protein n=1 Tax=Pseudonocardia sp. T1-2H TaxID=3128899 RepID=UPI0031011ABB
MDTVGNRELETGPRPVVDGTVLSPKELRDRVRDMQDGREEQVAQARTELAESLDRLGEGLLLVRAQMSARARHAGKIAAGVAAAGTTLALVVGITWVRTGKRITTD